MRHPTMLALICAVLLSVSCQDATAPLQASDPNDSFAPPRPGKLVVYVYWDAQGIPDKRVEVLELHLMVKTDTAGYAAFDVPSGRYTVRVYDVNRGGPATRNIDTSVIVTPGKETRIEVFDCLPCV